MKNKLSEITKIIQNRIANYELKNLKNENGVVVSVGDGIAIVQGLKNASYLEVVKFQNKATGIVFVLEENSLGIVILEGTQNIKENDQVFATGKIISVPTGDNFLGRVINSLGEVLDGKGKIKSSESRIIETIAPSVIVRESVNEPLEMGILAIDALLPIGKGQRELIIGDRQTGKTSIALDAIINQRDKNVICIYVAIGQKNTSILEVIKKLKHNNALAHTIIVVAAASDSEALKYIAPFSGMTIAEHYLKQGKQVLIVFDDLTKHAISYRGLSLLLGRSPGREAYPGDIFYLHSRLLERAVKLNKKNGGGSITALPIVETQLEDLSAYIPTNIISITDGQIFLLNELFNIGIKPAINFGLSVSRVGSAAQVKAIKQTIGSLKFDISQYRELEGFSQFGGNLDVNTVKILKRGSKIVELLKQKEGNPLPQ
ncbi:MAG: F0F1 ATP synthase subunit alpha [Mollicutes bacterium]|nr:MAG: F0F1 ATP synthase subunit alpha [Mollicutes bacterium]